MVFGFRQTRHMGDITTNVVGVERSSASRLGCDGSDGFIATEARCRRVVVDDVDDVAGLKNVTAHPPCVTHVA